MKQQLQKTLNDMQVLINALPDDFTFTKDKFMSFYKGTQFEKGASECFDVVTQALQSQGIFSSLTLIGALATIRVEVGRDFLPIKEIASGTAYEGRTDLGNTVKGDGVKYKGRGYIQLTGRSNYTHYGQLLGIDLVNNPDSALDELVSAKVLALYFKEHNINIACEQKNWTFVRQLVNGGSNGLSDFLRVINDYLN